MFVPYRHINAIGVELEGGWEDEPCECHDLKGDGSVQVQAQYVGEIPLGPFASWRDAEESIRRHYPQVVNRTCGLHVHLSFPDNGHYSALMSQRFETFLWRRLMLYGKRKNFSADGQYFQRLTGKNFYCRHRWNDNRVMEQARMSYKDEARYALINYCHRLHGTVEVRALPAFLRPASAVKAIKYLCDTFERYLLLPGALVPDVYTADGTTISGTGFPDEEIDYGVIGGGG